MASVNLGTITAFARLDSTGLLRGVIQAKAGLRDYESATKQTMGEAERAVSRSMQVISVAVVGALGLVAKKAAEFDQAMRNVNSIAKLSEDRFAALTGEVKRLANDPSITEGPTELAKGLYDVVSSGFSGTKALEVLRIGARGATAGMTDTATATRALTAVLNSGIKGVTDARQAMDVLFREVDLGVNSFEGLANSIGTVLPTAKLAGVSLQEVAASLAVMTRQGISVDESVTALNNLIIHILRPGKEVQDLFNQLGIQFGTAAFEGRGLTGALQEILTKTAGNKDEMVRLMPEIRAMKALLATTTDDGRRYTEMLAGISQATDGVGATELALQQQLKGAQKQWELFRKEAEILAINLGSSLLPAMRNVLGVLRMGASVFAAIPEPIRDMTVTIVALGASVLLTGTAIGRLSAGLKTLAASRIIDDIALRSMYAFEGIMRTLPAIIAAVTSPVGLATVAVVGLGAAAYILYQNLNQVSDASKDDTAAMLAQAEATQKAADDTKKLGDDTKKLADEYEKLAKKVKPSADEQKRLQEIMNAIGQAFPSLVKGWDETGNALKFVDGWAKKLTQSMKDAAEASLNAAHAVRIAQARTANARRGDLMAERASLEDLLRTQRALKPRTVTEAVPTTGPFVGTRQTTVYDRVPVAPNDPALAVTAKRIHEIDAEIKRMSDETKQILGIRATTRPGRPRPGAMMYNINPIDLELANIAKREGVLKAKFEEAEAKLTAAKDDARKAAVQHELNAIEKEQNRLAKRKTDLRVKLGLEERRGAAKEARDAAKDAEQRARTRSQGEIEALLTSAKLEDKLAGQRKNNQRDYEEDIRDGMRREDALRIRNNKNLAALKEFRDGLAKVNEKIREENEKIREEQERRERLHPTPLSASIRAVLSESIGPKPPAVTDAKGKPIAFPKDIDTDVRNLRNWQVTGAGQRAIDAMRPSLGGIAASAEKLAGGQQARAAISVDAAVRRIAGRTSGNIGFDTVIDDIERLEAVKRDSTRTTFEEIMDRMSKAYAFDYEQTNLAGENYLRFLQFRLDQTERYSDAWIAIQREMRRVEDDLRKQSTEGEKKTAKDKVNIWKEALKNLQRSLGDIFADLFENILTGQKNFLQSFFDAFRRMIIRIIAEIAASKVMEAITGLFNGGKRGGRTSGGTGGTASAGGGIGDIAGTAAMFASMIPGGQAVGAALGIFSGIGKVFGFDNPVNDQTANRFGFDFAQHFSNGALRGMKQPPVGLGGATQAIQIIVPNAVIREEMDIPKIATAVGRQLSWDTRNRLRTVTPKA